MDEGMHVVLGAGGGIGGALVEELRRRELRVRAVTRSALTMPAGVENVVADLDSTDSTKEALAGAAVVSLWLVLSRERVEGWLLLASSAGPAVLVGAWAFTRPALV